MRFLTALPVYNEARTVMGVVDEVLRYSPEVLLVDDGSTDQTSGLLGQRRDIQVVTHAENRGYGAALATAFEYAILHHYDVVVTIDCDGQHEPQRIPEFVKASRNADIVSGSRYLKQFAGDSRPPAERRRINRLVTGEVNYRLGLQLTDAFCGFKAYRTSALAQLSLREPGYGMPLELWVQASCAGLRIVELPVPLIYLDEKRSFGGALDDGDTRLHYYHMVLDRGMAAAQVIGGPAPAVDFCSASAEQCG